MPTTPTGIKRGFQMQNDMQQQAEWLSKVAAKLGMTLDDVVIHRPRMFRRLAFKWRARHPVFA